LFGNASLSAPAACWAPDKVLGQWGNVTKGQIKQRRTPGTLQKA
jgi:hypothetical protein